ncbi:MAG TPA: PAS domain-containing protein, partial [Stenomitos sp.]
MTFTESPGLTPLAAEPTAPTVSSEVRAEQMEMLVSQANAGTVTFLVNAGILCMVLWQAVPHGRLLGWYGLVLLLGACRIAVVAAYRREPKAMRGRARWLGFAMAGSLAAGVLWGMAGTLLIPAGNLMDQMFVAILLAGMAAGALPLLSAIWEVYLAYAIPALLPFTLWLAWQPDAVHHATGGLIAIFLVMMAFASRRYYVMVNETLHLRFENEQLQQSLNDAKVHAEVAAEELQSEMADRRKAEAALWQSEARFQKLIDQAADAFFLLDLEGRICEANQQA